MFVIFGERTYGVIERCGRAHIGTRFLHVQFFPVFPRASFLFVEDAARNVSLAMPIPLNARSVIAGYLRTWGVLFAAVAAIVAFVGHGGITTFAARPVYAALVVLAWMGFIAVAFGIGVLTPEERGQREAYASVVGAPFDAAKVPPSADRFAELEQRVIEAARPFAVSGYRDAVAPESAWPTLLASPEVRDAEIVRVALTLVRVRWAEASGAARVALEKQHAALWHRLVTLGVLDATAST